MVNQGLFQSSKSRLPRANVINLAGGLAYQLEAKHALAQLAATGTFNGTFYATGASQLDEMIKLVNAVDDNDFLAKLAIYSRQRAFMKDMPAALIAVLSTRDAKLTHKIFDQVIDNGRVLRTLFQMVRSGQFGRVGLSSSLKRAFQRWFNSASVPGLLSASIGNDPSLRDVMRMARPRPIDDSRRALFGWLTNRPVENWAPATQIDLPKEVDALLRFRSATRASEQISALRNVSIRWDLLADSAIDSSVWKVIAEQMGPQALRMNLNTLQRHGVLQDAGFVDSIAKRIADDDAVKRSRQFPYQFFAAYLNASADIPNKIRKALHQAAEISCGNIPQLAAPIVIGLDVSGSMQWTTTGSRGRGASSKVRCVDAAALFAAAMLRVNPDSIVVPFDTSAYQTKIDPNDSILSIAERLAAYGGGGTDCSLPLAFANQNLKKQTYAGCVLVSDNESWVGSGRYGSTAVMTEWKKFYASQKTASQVPKLVCLDIQPNSTTQAPESADVLNIGGFSDSVFKVVAGFLSGDNDRFIKEIESIEI